MAVQFREIDGPAAYYLTPLKPGDRHEAVRYIKRLLNVRDGWLGLDKTFDSDMEQAIEAAQRRLGFEPADGALSPAFVARLREDAARFQVQRLDDDAYEALASRLDVDMAALRAALVVLGSHRGFDLFGRVDIRFSREAMYRELEAGGVDADSIHEWAPRLVSPFTGGFIDSETEHAWLGSAMRINADAALRATRFGAFRFPGRIARALGYDSVRAFADAMRSEPGQLEAFALAIERGPVPLPIAWGAAQELTFSRDPRQALREHDWYGLARWCAAVWHPHEAQAPWVEDYRAKFEMVFSV